MSKNLKERKEHFTNSILNKVLQNNSDVCDFMGSNYRVQKSTKFGEYKHNFYETNHMNGKNESYLTQVSNMEECCFALQKIANFYVKDIPIDVEENECYFGYVFYVDDIIVNTEKFLECNKNVEFTTYTYIDKKFRICKITDKEKEIILAKSGYVKVLSNGAKQFVGPKMVYIDKAKNVCLEQEDITKKIMDFINKIEEELNTLLTKQI